MLAAMGLHVHRAWTSGAGSRVQPAGRHGLRSQQLVLVPSGTGGQSTIPSHGYSVCMRCSQARLLRDVRNGREGDACLGPHEHVPFE